MSVTAQKALNAALKSKAFEPVYYLHGADDYQKDDALKRLISAAVDAATRDFNLEVRRGPELDGGTLASLLGTPPMMAERRLVAIRDATALKKDARAALERYLERPASDTVVVLVAAADAKADKLLLEKCCGVEYPPLTGDRLPKWIAHYARTELGTEITPEAVKLLENCIGDDLRLLGAELDKLASYANGGTIDEVAVSAVVGVQRGETMGDLLDAVAARDAVTAIGLVDHVLAQPKTSAVQVVMALSTQTLAMAWGQTQRERGVPAGRMVGEFMNLLKQGGAYPGRSWGEATSAWARHLDRWSARAFDEALALLLDADVSLKETRLSSEEQVLATLVLGMCLAGEPRADDRAAA
jgi:DNA polymerase-3 subunit delta